MPGPGKTAAAETDRLEAEIASIFLNEYVCGHLRSAEEAMEGAVDAHAFGNAVCAIGMGRIQLPALVQLDQRQSIGSVAIDFVRTGKHEHGIGRVPASEFQQVQRSGGIDRKIREGLARCPIVRGLRCGVEYPDYIFAVFSK